MTLVATRVAASVTLITREPSGSRITRESDAPANTQARWMITIIRASTAVLSSTSAVGDRISSLEPANTAAMAK